MSIQMVGIDFNRASIEERESFSFTQKQSGYFLMQIKHIEGILGCVILSTCNRMELWLSCNGNFKGNILELIGTGKKVDIEQYKKYFVSRFDYDAVEHLFYLASGMKSQIIGEDQILTQVKNALEFSRLNDGTDNVLEVLFRMAITSAKEVKTAVHLSKANTSIIDQVIIYLKSTGCVLEDKKCMVIGNGEIGKLAATKLKEEGAQVTVTVRQYKSGVVEIPKGCHRINYGDRLEHISGYDIVISATASPNNTLRYDQLHDIEFETPKLMIDLAVPRDIDPEIAKLKQVTLYDIDFFHVETQSEQMKLQIKQIDEMLQVQIEEFISWFECRDCIPILQKVSEQAAIDVQMRIQKTIKNLEMNEEEKELLEDSIYKATNKVLSKLMFGMRDTVSTSTFQECIEAMQKIY